MISFVYLTHPPFFFEREYFFDEALSQTTFLSQRHWSQKGKLEHSLAELRFKKTVQKGSAERRKFRSEGLLLISRRLFASCFRVGAFSQRSLPFLVLPFLLGGRAASGQFLEDLPPALAQCDVVGPVLFLARRVTVPGAAVRRVVFWFPGVKENSSFHSMKGGTCFVSQV